MGNIPPLGVLKKADQQDSGPQGGKHAVLGAWETKQEALC